MRTIDEILNKIKDIKGLRTDTELAALFNVKPQTLSTWRKRQTIPFGLIIALCEKEKWPISWLLAGQIITKKVKLEDGREILTMADEPGLYKKEEEKPEVVSEDRPLYNNVKSDPELEEILRYFLENPQDKKFCLKMIKGKKEIREAVEGFISKNLLKEEG